MFSDPERNIEAFELEPNSFVADLGAGSGFYTVAAAKALQGGGRVYAIDVQKDLLERIKLTAQHERLSNVEILWGDIERLGGTKLREMSVDAVILSNTLFQVTHKKELVTEIRRILKPKGKVLLVDWIESFGGMGPAPEAVVYREDAEALFTQNGFRLEREISAGEHHYGLILRKTS